MELVPRRDGKPGYEYNPCWYEERSEELCRAKKGWKVYKSRWLLMQHARMIRLAMSFANYFEKKQNNALDENKLKNIEVLHSTNKTSISILDAVARDGSSWQGKEESLLRGQTIPFPIPVVQIPEHKRFRDISDNISYQQICWILHNVAEQLLFSLRMKVAPVEIPLDRILLAKKDDIFSVYLACADFAIGPLTINGWELENDPEPTHVALHTLEKLLYDTAKMFQFDRLRKIVNICRGFTENENFGDDADSLRLCLLSFDDYLAALEKEAKRQHGPSLYLDSANIERGGFMGLDTYIRWRYFMKRLQQEFPNKISSPPETLYANRRTGDSNRYKRFFSSLRQYHAVVDREEGEEPGDQADDERLKVRVVSDITKRNATEAIVITHDKQLLDSIADEIGDENLIRIDPVLDDKIQSLFRECAL